MQKQPILSPDVGAMIRHGNAAASANERFRLVWKDAATTEELLAGTALGRYLILDGGNVVVEGRMERPSYGKVADDGTFVLNDGRRIGDLSGTFRAFSRDGTAIFVQHFAANLFTNGLSDDGKWAACSTANSMSDTDGGVTAIFDLEAGREYSRFRPESGWPLTYEFSTVERVVRLGYPNEGGEYSYSFNGAFVDRARWIEDRLAEGDLRVARTVLDEAGGRPDEKSAQRLLVGLSGALRDGYYRDTNSRAASLRLRGECLEGRGDQGAALACYDQALALWPGVGVRRRAEALRRKGHAGET